jgi:hypothetical protein
MRKVPAGLIHLELSLTSGRSKAEEKSKVGIRKYKKFLMLILVRLLVRRETRSPSRCPNGTHLCGKLHLSQLMKLTITFFVFLVLAVTSCIHAETSDAVTRKLFIDPSSTSVALGKASLMVSPLTHRDGNYVGDYQLKVRPYFFKSEKGSLLLAASDDSVRKLQAGKAIDFTGKAVTRTDGKIHVVLGKATPSSGDRGSVTFSIINGERKDGLQHFLSLREEGKGAKSRKREKGLSLTFQRILPFRGNNVNWPIDASAFKVKWHWPPAEDR